MLEIDLITEEGLSKIVFNREPDLRHCVKSVMIRLVGSSSIQLWHALDVSDFSTFRSFVVPFEGDWYDVDFLSRHEIVSPMSVEKLPQGWDKWAIVHKNQLIVTDKTEFCSRMMTPDAVVALPTYRFEFLMDDVKSAVAGGMNIDEALLFVLESLVTGYSYKKYTPSSRRQPVHVFSLDKLLPRP